MDNRLADIRARLAASKSASPPLSMDSRDEDIEWLLRQLDAIGNENDELRLPPTKEGLIGREWARRLVDAIWNAATESEVVPSTEWADRIIDSIGPPHWQEMGREICQLRLQRDALRDNLESCFADAARWQFVRKYGPTILFSHKRDRERPMTWLAMESADAAIDAAIDELTEDGELTI